MGDQVTFVPGVDTPDDLAGRARKRLQLEVYDHVIGGAGDERTVAANLAGFGRYRLLPRVCTGDLSRIDTHVSILGTDLDAPIFVSPTGGIASVCENAELSKAGAAAAAGVGYIVTPWPEVPSEDIATVAGPARWQAMYWFGNREVAVDLVQRFEASGYTAIVLGVDNQTRPARRRLLRHAHAQGVAMYKSYPGAGGVVAGSTVTPNAARYLEPDWEGRVKFNDRGHVAAQDEEEPALTWKNVEWLRSRMRVPLIVKGVMTPADAEEAINSGADSIMVSNHGGRYLDSEPGTIEVLEDIVERVGGRIPVLLDGGVRRSSDIAIALGLGAAAVGLGRPVVWALAAGGQAVASAYLTDLVDDLKRTMGILGVTAVGEITKDRVSRRDQYLTDAALRSYLPLD